MASDALSDNDSCAVSSQHWEGMIIVSMYLQDEASQWLLEHVRRDLLM